MKTWKTYTVILLLTALQACNYHERRLIQDEGNTGLEQFSVYDRQVVRLLENHLYMGQWQHHYHFDEAMLYYSILQLNDFSAPPQEEENPSLPSFIANIGLSYFAVRHKWEDGIIVQSIHQQFTIYWEYGPYSITGGVLIERDSGIIHRLGSPN